MEQAIVKPYQVTNMPEQVQPVSDVIMAALGVSRAVMDAFRNGYTFQFNKSIFDYIIVKEGYPVILIDRRDISVKEQEYKTRKAKELGDIYVYFPRSVRSLLPNDLAKIVDDMAGIQPIAEQAPDITNNNQDNTRKSRREKHGR